MNTTQVSVFIFVPNRYSAMMPEETKEPASAKRAKSNSKSGLVLVLDMDETLIFKSCYDAEPYKNRERTREAGPLKDCLVQKLDPLKSQSKLERYGHIALRPGVQTFLETVTTKYETYILTAADECKANPVLDYLESLSESIEFAGRWCAAYKEHVPKLFGNKKMLAKIPELEDRLHRVVLVDNDPVTFLDTPDNGILVNSFYEDPCDDTLSLVVTILEEIENAPDVRPLLRDKFQMGAALTELIATEWPEHSSEEKEEDDDDDEA